MFIERGISEDFADSGDQDYGVTTSPMNLCSFYENSHPLREPTYLATRDRRLWSPSSHSQSGNRWSCGACPNQTNNHLNIANDENAMGSVRTQWYHGVRVKNPVKELIMQKRSNHGFFSPDNETNQVLQHSDTHAHCPGLTTVLQVRKRPADHVLSTLCPKRPAFLCDSVLTPYSFDTLKDNSGCLEPYLDLTDKIRESAPVSITTAQVQDIFSQAVALCNIVPPLAGTPTETSVPPMYPTTNPGNLCEVMGNGAVISCTPQADLPLPLSFDVSSGMSFFQWQIKQEEKKVAGLAPEQIVVQDSDGDTFLHIAVAKGRRALSYVLAKTMALVNMLDVKEHNDQSALQLSVAANQHLIVQDLINLGAQINTVDCWGRSPLHVCAEKGHVLTLQTIHRALLATAQQVNMEAVNYDGLTPLHTAVLSHNAVVQDLGCEAVQHSPLMQALVLRRKLLGQCINTLLLMGASYTTKDRKSGRTSLHMAAEEANVELFHLFLDQPESLAIVNAKTYNGNTALHVVSALKGKVAQVEAVKLLMRHGADPGIKNLEKEQPSQLVPKGTMGHLVWRILKGRGA